MYVSESHSVVSDCLRSHGLYSPRTSPGQNTGVGSHALLQGIFPIQGLNPGPDTAIISTKETRVLEFDIGTQSQTPPPLTSRARRNPTGKHSLLPLLAPSRAGITSLEWQPWGCPAWLLQHRPWALPGQAALPLDSLPSA